MIEKEEKAEEVDIREAISNFNQQARKFKNEFWIFETLIVIAAIIAFAVSLSYSMLPFSLILGLVVLLLLSSINISSYLTRRNSFFKKYIAGFAVKSAFGSGAVYVPHGDVSRAELTSYNLFKVATIVQEDFIKAAYKGVEFTSLDVRSYTVSRDANGHSNTCVFFDGIVLIYDFNKPFEGEIRIVENEAGAPPSFDRHLKKVEFESEEFNRAFEVYATDELTAFYVLTPQLLVGLLELHKRIKGAFSFRVTGTTLFVAVGGAKNHLEARSFKKFSEADLARMIAELEPLRFPVDLLGLDKTLFEDTHRILRGGKKNS